MEKLYVVLILAIFSNAAMSMNIRNKRQTQSDDENSLEDKYGWDRPRRPQQWGNQNQPWQQNPWQNQWELPNQNQGQRPNQNGNQGNQGQRPNQNWNQGNQGQRPNQNGNQGQRPNQNWNQGNQGQNPNQNWNQGNQGQFPDPNGQNGQNPGTTQRPTQRPNGSTTTTLPPQISACVASCPVTPEYNPVCGSDGTTYSNPGRLSCAQSCGVNVSLSRSAPCPTTTTTAAPL